MVTVPAAVDIVSAMVMPTSKLLAPRYSSLRGPSSRAFEPAEALYDEMLPAVPIVAVPVALVCLIRIVPAAEVAPVVSVSFVSSASSTVIQAVSEPASVCVDTVVPASPVDRSFAVHGTG